MDQTTKKTARNAKDQQRLVKLLPKIKARACRLVRQKQDAEDIAQDVVLGVLVAFHSGVSISNLENYAMVALRHGAAANWKRLQTVSDRDPEIASATNIAPTTGLSLDINRAVNALPANQSVLMRAILNRQTSPSDLAAQFGIPKGTVMSRLARARARLRADLEISGLHELL